MPINTIKFVLQEAQSKLLAVSDSPALDAELLLAFCLDKNRSYLFTWPDHVIDEAKLIHFNELIDKRLTDYPVAYLLETKPFWTLDLLVTPDVLIPRPETELLVEIALKKIDKIESPKILDLGTGSGAIALALASERPDAQVIACDYSNKALEVAKRNAENSLLNFADKNEPDKQVTFIESDWLSNISDTNFDLIVSNPPYIAPDDPHLNQTIRHEPHQALVADNAGMKDIETIIKNSKEYLKKGCWLMIEHGYDQKDQTLALYKQFGYEEAKNYQDIGQNPRLSIAKLPI
jgi:release factor glutamine methyltransferase